MATNPIGKKKLTNTIGKKWLSKALSVSLAAAMALSTVLGGALGALAIKPIKAAAAVDNTLTEALIAKNRKVIGYFCSWRDNELGAYYTIEDVPWGKITHINFAFALPGTPQNNDWDRQNELPESYKIWISDGDKKVLRDLVAYKKQVSPQTKIVMSVGGWASTGFFYPMMDSEANMQEFADSCVKMIRDYGIDGIDIDFEHPSMIDGGVSGNPNNFNWSKPRSGTIYNQYVKFMKILNETIDAGALADGHGPVDKGGDGSGYLLTAAGSASGWVLRGEALAEYCAQLDYINLMSYDYHGSWNNMVWHQAALMPTADDPENPAAYDPYLNVDWTVNYYLGAMPAEKINIGVPYYTRGWTNTTGGKTVDGSRVVAVGTNDKNTIPTSSNGTATGLAGSSPKTDVTGEGIVTKSYGPFGIDGVWNDPMPEQPAGANSIYHMMNLLDGKITSSTENILKNSWAWSDAEIAALKKDFAADITAGKGYKKYRDTTAKVPYIYNETTKSFFTFEDKESIAAKAQYIVDHQLGGYMTWEFSGDYSWDSVNNEWTHGDTLTTTAATVLAGGAATPISAKPSASDIADFTWYTETMSEYPFGANVQVTNKTGADWPGGATVEFDCSAPVAEFSTEGTIEGISISSSLNADGSRHVTAKTAAWNAVTNGSSIKLILKMTKSQKGNGSLPFTIKNLKINGKYSLQEMKNPVYATVAVDDKNLSNASVAPIPDQNLNGTTQIQPNVTVKDSKGNTLTKDTDYTVSYGTNNTIGTDAGSVTITGKGTYKGAQTVKFNIVDPSAKDITNAVIAAIPNQAFTGSEVKPEITVTLGGKTLVKDTDYVVGFSNNTNLGEAAVTVTAKPGNAYGYTGATNAKFNIIDKIDLGGADTKIGISPVVFDYDGKVKTPSLTVSVGSTAVASANYDIIYSNNTGSATAPTIATVAAKAKATSNEYKNQIAGDFIIIQPSDTGASSADYDEVYDPSKTYNQVGEHKDTKVLYNGHIYRIKSGQWAGAGMGPDSPWGVSLWDDLGAYTTSAPTKTDMSSAAINGLVASYAYTGSAVEPAVTVSLNGSTLTAGTDYDLYRLNKVRKGESTIVAVGKGSYYGYVTASFAIETTGSTPAPTPTAGAPTPTAGAPTPTAGAPTPTAGAPTPTAGTPTATVKPTTAPSPTAGVTPTPSTVNAKAPVINTNPVSAVYEVGDTTKALSVTATSADGGTLSYQWYSNTTSGTSGAARINGATSSTYALPAASATGTTYYYVVVTNTNNSVTGTKTATATSNPATIIVTPKTDTVQAPTIITQPVGASYSQGILASLLSVKASVSKSDELTYQWYKNTTNSKVGATPIVGAINASLTPYTDTVGKAYYYVKITNNFKGDTASVDSNVVEISVTAVTAMAQAPNINTQPVGASYVEGTSAAALTVGANSPDGGTLSYQWYSNTTNSVNGGTKIANATSASYTPLTTTVGTKYYYVIVTNLKDGKTATKSSSVVSIAVSSMVVSAQSPIISQQPASAVYTLGASNVTLSVEAQSPDGGSLSYQWYSNTTSSTVGGTAVAGANQKSYSPSTAATGTKYYYVIITNTKGGTTKTAVSSAATITIVPVSTTALTPNIVSQPTSAIYNKGDVAAALSVTASSPDGGVLTYQWYSNTTASTSGGTAIVGAVSSSFVPPTSAKGTLYYYVVVTNTKSGTEARRASSFAAVSVKVIGDANNSGGFDVNDILSLLRHIAGKQILTGANYIAADVNNDTEVDVKDVLVMLRVLAGKINF